MNRKRRKKPPRSRASFWVFTLFIIAAIIVGWRLWPCYYNPVPRFHSLSMVKDTQPFTLENGETGSLHPRDRIRIDRISTNVCLNRGIRLASTRIDINALRYATLPIGELLGERDMLERHEFTIEVLHYNKNLGFVTIVIEPYIEDWLDKADRSIGSQRKIEILERARILAPSDNRVRERLVREYSSLHQWREVAQLLEEMVKEEMSEQLLTNLLEVYESLSDTGNVLSVLHRYKAFNPDNLDIRFRLASELEKTEKRNEAIKEYEELLKLINEADALPLYKTLGFLYTQSGLIENAVSYYLKAIAMDKKDVNLYYNISYLYEKMGQQEKADIFLAEAIKLKSSDIENRLLLSERLIEKGQLADAERYLQEILQKDPKSIGAVTHLLTIAEKKGDKEQLRKYYGMMHTLSPNDKNVMYNLGVLSFETGHFKEAIPYFQSLLKSDPENKELHEFLFAIYQQLNETDQAYQEALVLVKKSPQQIAYYHFLFDVLNKRGKFSELVEIMEKGLTHHSKETDLHRYLILAYLKTGKEKNAVLAMKQLLNMIPKDADLLLQAAKLTEKLGEWEDALAFYGKLYEQSPNDAAIREKYVQFLLKNAQQQEKEKNDQVAMKTYQKILDISPDNEAAADAYLSLRLKVLPRDQ